MGIFAKYRHQNEQLQRTLEGNRHAISELEAKIKELDATIQSESERCAKANDEKTSGIRYAQRIQRAAFPQREIAGIFSDYFIFTKPMGIVTGDFFKALEIKHYKIFVLADCAGHGVPGAFITMLGLSALKESFALHYDDHDIHLAPILDEMRQFIKTTLRSNNNDIDAINVGMNISLCAFSKDGGGIRFAGTDQNVYLYSNAGLAAYNGDKMPIGWSLKGDAPFSETIIPAQKGDILYIATDSLRNQFGGPTNEKFSTKRLAAMFEAIATLPLDKQKATIDDTVNRWVDGHILVDDITLAGVRVA